MWRHDSRRRRDDNGRGRLGRFRRGYREQPGSHLVLLRHKFLRREPLPAGVAQHGHRERALTSAMINLLRIVAIELGMWRSVLGGGAPGSVTFGNRKFFEPRGVTRS